jgi:hypothetical protein
MSPKGLRLLMKIESGGHPMTNVKP